VQVEAGFSSGDEPMRFAGVIFLALLLLPAVAIAGPFDDAQVAYDRGDYQTAAKVWQQLANQGDAAAQVVIGRMYWTGRGVNRDYSEAAKWWLKAAKQDNTDAESLIGGLYWDGQGVNLSYVEAEKWYQKAADKGDQMAEFRISEMYEIGHGKKQDRRSAEEWLRKAADQGDAAAQAQLGTWYLEGHGVPKDIVQSYMWLSLAEAAGSERAPLYVDFLTKKMTPEQIAEAKRLASEWKPTPPQPPVPAEATNRPGAK
jgi:TPR repeat protein